MLVMVLTACPPGLRGDITRWLLEISPGVFVGKVSRRVRENLWLRVKELVGRGRAIMVYSARNEQHLQFEVWNHDWETEDFDGMTLIRRPLKKEDDGPKPGTGQSHAGRRRRYGRR